MAEPNFKIIDQKIGLLGATVLAIGNAIAATTFIVPAELLAQGVGPSMALAAMIVIIPTAVMLICMLQLGGAMPATGGTYVYNSVLLSPYWGFARPWVTLPAIWFGLAFTATGFAQYFRYYLPLGIDVGLVAITIPVLSTEFLIGFLIALFLIINILGIRTSTIVQYGLVGVIILASLVFIAGGIFHVDPANFTPLFPSGSIDPFVAAVITLFLGMTGFSLPLNIAEELEDPIKNIPRSIVLSTVIGMALLTLLIVVAVGAVHWTEWAGAEAGLAVVAAEFLPWWGVFLVAAAAIIGAFTTVNAVFINSSRIIMRSARDDIIPNWLSRVNKRWQSPDAALLATGIPALIIVPFAPSLLDVAFVLSLSFLLDMLWLSLGSLQLTRKYPALYENATYKFPKYVLYPVVSLGVLIPLGLWVLMGLGEGSTLVIATAAPVWLLLGYVVYRLRVRQFRKKGVDLPERMRHLHEHEAEMSSNIEGASKDSTDNPSLETSTDFTETPSDNT